MIKVSDGPATPFTGEIAGAHDMIEELVPHFWQKPERDTDEPDESYSSRCEADRQGAMIQMAAGAQYAFAGSMVDRAIETITSGKFVNATLFTKDRQGRDYRRMVGDWIEENFYMVAPDIKSRATDVICILLPALSRYEVNHDPKAVIDMIVGSGTLSIPGKVRAACETLKDLGKDESLTNELVSSVYEAMVDETKDMEDVRKAGGKHIELAKASGTIHVTEDGTRFIIDVIGNERLADTIEDRLKRWVEWRLA